MRENHDEDFRRKGVDGGKSGERSRRRGGTRWYLGGEGSAGHILDDDGHCYGVKREKLEESDIR